MAFEGDKRAAFRIAMAGFVVLVGLIALVWGLIVTLDHYQVQEAKNGVAANDRSSAVVAVMTPLAAGIAAIVGLYFGISATGSKRGQEGEAEIKSAEAKSASHETTKELAEASKSLPPEERAPILADLARRE